MHVLLEYQSQLVFESGDYYPGAKPEEKHALNKQDALNSELRLLSRVYSIPVYITACMQCVH